VAEQVVVVYLQTKVKMVVLAVEQVQMAQQLLLVVLEQLDKATQVVEMVVLLLAHIQQAVAVEQVQQVIMETALVALVMVGQVQLHL
jgi:hypothetical protein